jgi:hypothetical protein
MVEKRVEPNVEQWADQSDTESTNGGTVPYYYGTLLIGTGGTYTDEAGECS